eukprot:CAMPEP_0176340282 /NCGR_PEP_ID=MMETSP0126-20121128/1449_1 /TAXON_ID=141414 ORGANISM="Strombidinopsis acuminatum, Strain SPMC142" /NCGR_SAMPLE_ID=MMETSP0126 /ASSEMBLY_ACC=CAM_ASM_000229 /LENGTH=35 /DNA_ID= /DNA_START= /DNA_END= /DNA_ORIENTATION=
MSGHLWNMNTVAMERPILDAWAEVPMPTSSPPEQV